MKRIISMLLVLIAVMGLIPLHGEAQEVDDAEFKGMVKPRARTIETYEVEPNNSPAQAQALEQSDTWVEGELHYSNDPDDYYYIYTEDSLFIVISGVSGAGGENTTKFRLYDEDKNLLKTASYEGEITYTGSTDTDDEYYLEYELDPGMYYLRVSDTTNWIAYGFYIYGESMLDAPVVSTSNSTSTGKPIVKWGAVSGASSYSVSRATSKNGTYSTIATVTDTSYTDTAPKAGKTYYYKVKAHSADTYTDLDSRWSNAKSVVCKLARPVASTSNVASTGKNVVSWKALKYATNYKVFIFNSEGKEIATANTTTNSYVHESAVPGEIYIYKVRGYIKGVADAYSARSKAVNRVCDLAQPKITVANDANGKVKVSWKAIKGATSYKLYIYDANGELLKTATTSKTAVTHSSGEVAETYTYKLRAYMDVAAATSAYSAEKEGTCVLAQPTATVKLNSSGKPKISWTAVDGAVKYKLYIYDANGELLKTTTTTKTALNHSAADKGVTYKYRVRAIYSDAAGNSEASSTVSITSK